MILTSTLLIFHPIFLSSHFFIQFLITKGTKKRHAPNAARKGGGGENEQLQPCYQIRDKDRNETGQTNKDLR